MPVPKAHEFQRKAKRIIESFGGRIDVENFELRWAEAFPENKIERRAIIHILLRFSSVIHHSFLRYKKHPNDSTVKLIADCKIFDVYQRRRDGLWMFRLRLDFHKSQEVNGGFSTVVSYVVEQFSHRNDMVRKSRMKYPDSRFREHKASERARRPSPKEVFSEEEGSSDSPPWDDAPLPYDDLEPSRLADDGSEDSWKPKPAITSSIHQRARWPSPQPEDIFDSQDEADAREEEAAEERNSVAENGEDSDSLEGREYME